MSETENDGKPFSITEAVIKDDFCNYKYEVKIGVGAGDSHSVKGRGIIDNDMRIQFAKFKAHLAFIDEAFKRSGIEVPNIDQFHDHELTHLYNVTGFKIKGSEDNESIILVGNKFLATVGGRMEIETPAIPIDTLSSYSWYNELKELADNVRHEVYLYANGKCTPVDHDDEDKGGRQLSIADEMKESGIEVKVSKRKKKKESEESDSDFEEAKV